MSFLNKSFVETPNYNKLTNNNDNSVVTEKVKCELGDSRTRSGRTVKLPNKFNDFVI